MMSVIFATYYLRFELTMREWVGTSKDRTPKVEKDKNVERQNYNFLKIFDTPHAKILLILLTPKIFGQEQAGLEAYMSLGGR